MKYLLIAAALAATVASGYAEAGRYGSSSRSYSSRSYSRPASRPSTPAKKVVRQVPKAQPRVVRQTTIVQQRVIYKPTRITRNYNQLSYYRPQPQPSFFSSNMGWIAFSALGAYMLLSPDEQAKLPAPDTAPLKEVPMQDISKALWADGKFSAEDVAIYNEWKKINGK